MTSTDSSQPGESYSGTQSEESRTISVIEDVYHSLQKPPLSLNQFKDEVAQTSSDLGEYATLEESAELVKQKYQSDSLHQISSLTPESGTVTIRAQIVDIGTLRSFEHYGRNDNYVCNLQLQDSTGTVRVAFWNKHAEKVTKLEPGDTLVIKADAEEPYHDNETVQLSANTIKEIKKTETQSNSPRNPSESAIAHDTLASEPSPSKTNAQDKSTNEQSLETISGVILRIDSPQISNTDELLVARSILVGHDRDIIPVTLWNEQAGKASQFTVGQQITVTDTISSEQSGITGYHSQPESTVDASVFPNNKLWSAYTPKIIPIQPLIDRVNQHTNKPNGSGDDSSQNEQHTDDDILSFVESDHIHTIVRVSSVGKVNKATTDAEAFQQITATSPSNTSTDPNTSNEIRIELTGEGLVDKTSEKKDIIYLANANYDIDATGTVVLTVSWFGGLIKNPPATLIYSDKYAEEDSTEITLSTATPLEQNEEESTEQPTSTQSVESENNHPSPSGPDEPKEPSLHTEDSDSSEHPAEIGSSSTVSEAKSDNEEDVTGADESPPQDKQDNNSSEDTTDKSESTSNPGHSSTSRLSEAPDSSKDKKSNTQSQESSRIRETSPDYDEQLIGTIINRDEENGKTKQITLAVNDGSPVSITVTDISQEDIPSLGSETKVRVVQKEEVRSAVEFLH